MSRETITVIKVRNLLMVTMPADPDDATISALQEKTLEAMERYNAMGLILDLSKVDTLDSYFARTVTETGKMVDLMGGETIIAGMRPAVAITATQLGLNLGVTRTALGVDEALNMVDADSRRGRSR
jgi:rsbT antagonist protein RsbS